MLDLHTPSCLPPTLAILHPCSGMAPNLHLPDTAANILTLAEVHGHSGAGAGSNILTLAGPPGAVEAHTAPLVFHGSSPEACSDSQHSCHHIELCTVRT